MTSEISAKCALNITRGSFYIRNVMMSIYKQIRIQAEKGNNNTNYTVAYPKDTGISKDAVVQAVYLKLSELGYTSNFQDCPDIEGISFTISWK